MKKKIIFALLFACSFCVNIFSQNTDFSKELKIEQAGTLKKNLSEQEIKDLKSIKVKGKVNEADIAILSLMATKHKLEIIDLGEALFSRTESKLLESKTQYFLPMIASLKTDNIKGVEEYETSLGHTKDSRSLPGFWMFNTNMDLFFMTGYMNGWDKKINEVVLKTQKEDLLRSPQIRSWIEAMGYEYRDSRTDGDIIFENPKTKIWCLLHFTPYGKTDFPGIHFSSEKYEMW